MQWLIARDAEALLSFAPLGGETAKALALPVLMPEEGVAGSLVYVNDAGALVRSRAIFALLGVVRSGWRWLRVFRFAPAWLTDLPYRLVARLRYRVFGRVDACALPSAALRPRLLP